MNENEIILWAAIIAAIFSVIFTAQELKEIDKKYNTRNKKKEKENA